MDDKKGNMRLLSSQKLKEKILEVEGLDKNILRGTGHQVHHLIPNEVLVHFLKAYRLEDDEIVYLTNQFDREWSGVALLTQDDAVCHLGSHSFYDIFIEAVLSSREYSSINEFIEYAQALAQWIRNELNKVFPNLRKKGIELNIDEFTESVLIHQMLKELNR